MKNSLQWGLMAGIAGFAVSFVVSSTPTTMTNESNTAPGATPDSNWSPPPTDPPRYISPGVTEITRPSTSWQKTAKALTTLCCNVPILDPFPDGNGANEKELDRRTSRTAVAGPISMTICKIGDQSSSDKRPVIAVVIILNGPATSSHGTEFEHGTGESF